MNEYTYEILEVCPMSFTMKVGYIAVEINVDTKDARVLGGVVCPSFQHASEILASFLED